MKIEYKTATGIIEIEVDEDWGNRVLEFNRSDYNAERKDHRSDHKYHCGQTMSLDDAESFGYAQIKHKHGLLETDALPKAVFRTQEYARLCAAVDQLPTDQRDLVRAVYYGGRKAADYARAHGISKAAVSQRLKRALHHLKNNLLTR
jgi:RNA polymerase sigma factor (sigma-70 family)